MSDRCRDVLERVVEAMTGTVKPADRQGIAEHLAICDRCREEAAALEATATYLRGAGSFRTPPDFWAQFTNRLDERLAGGRASAAARLRRWLATPRHAWGTVALTAAASLAISAAVRHGSPAPSPDPVAAQVRTLVTDTMSSTLPSLAEMLEVMGAGFPVEADLVNDRGRP